MASASARVPRMNFGRENIVSKKVTKDDLVEMVYGLKEALEDGLKEIHEKFKSLDTRVKSLTEYVNVLKEKEKRMFENAEENETEEAEENETEEAGEKEKGIEEAGEKEKEMAGEKKMEEAGEDGGKTLKKYERKRRGKEQGEPSEGGGQRRKVMVRSPVMTRQKKKV